jgi:hypothetical protein
MLSTEQKAWQLHENGVSFTALQMTAISHECSGDWAVELMWDELLGKKILSHSCQPKIINGWEFGCCKGK